MLGQHGSKVAQQSKFFFIQKFSTTMQNYKGLVVGVFPEEHQVSLTPTARALNDKHDGRLQQLITLSGLSKKKSKCRVFYGVDPEYDGIAVVSLGGKDQEYNSLEGFDERRESIRAAVADGVCQLRDAGVKVVDVDPCGDPEAAAEGATLSLWCYDELKAEEKRKPQINVQCSVNESSVTSSWKRGSILAECQNFARKLMETPANKMTPSIFAQRAEEKLAQCPGVQVRVRDRNWAESMKMGSFLSVSNGSMKPPKFIEIEYKGGNPGEQSLALVGKGVTFDSGGISIKPSQDMDRMRADMGGAACVLATTLAIAQLQLPINVMTFIPLCENMPGGMANKPGDVVTAMNGKTIQVDNTDAEGRLILADALCYAETFKPRAILDVATLTGAMIVSLGAGAAGTFTNSKMMWELLEQAGGRTGDRLWRLPLFSLYNKQMTKCHLADINNIGSAGRAAGSATAAGFLKEFVTNENWAHIDIAGVMWNNDEVPYLCKGMSGRPVRTLVEFVKQLSQQK